MEDLSIVIPAAGVGDRLGLGPKALLQLKGRPLLHWVCSKAKRLAGEVIVAAPPGRVDEWKEHCLDCRVIEGGASFLASMARLVKCTSRPMVMNVNVAMPFVDLSMMTRLVEQARVDGIAGSVLSVDSPVAQLVEGKLISFMPRQVIGVAVGPNAYRRKIILDLIERADADDWKQQSFLQVAVRYGYAITAVPCGKFNIKITTREDWIQAQALCHLL